MTCSAEMNAVSGPLAIDERAEPRALLRLRAALKCQTTPSQDVFVVDLAQSGCRLLINRKVSVGTLVHLGIIGFADLPGWVAWSNTRSLGLNFCHRLPDAVMAHIVNLASGPKRTQLRGEPVPQCKDGLGS